MSKRNFAQLSSEYQERIEAEEMEQETKRVRIEEILEEEGARFEEETLARIHEEMLEEKKPVRFEEEMLEEEERARFEEEVFVRIEEERLEEEERARIEEETLARIENSAFRLYTLVLSLGHTIQKISKLVDFANLIFDSDLELPKAELPSANDVESSENDLPSADNGEEQQRPIEDEPEPDEDDVHAPIEVDEEIIEDESSDEEILSNDDTSDLDDSFTEEAPNNEITAENCTEFDVYIKTQAYKQSIQSLLNVLKQKKFISDSEFERYEAKLQFNFPLPSNDMAAIEEEMLILQRSDSNDSLLGDAVDKFITKENCSLLDVSRDIVAFQQVLFIILNVFERLVLAKQIKVKEVLEQPVAE